MSLDENKQNLEQLSIFADNSTFTLTPPNIILNCGNAKIVFDKQQIQINDILEVYIKLKNYLNTFNEVYL